MSAPSSTRPSATASLTRQQLDELDALLQRMLQLPVHPFAEGPSAEEAPASVAVLEPEPEPLSPPPPAPISRVEPPPAVRTAHPLAVRELPMQVPDMDEADAAPPLLWTWPLIWCNQAFEFGTRRVGRPGLWLRHPAGRALLGWTGLLCLLAAVGLLVYDWIRTRW